MRSAILLSLFILAAFPGRGQTKSFIDRPYIEVTGKADTLLTPNEIYINIVLSERDTRDKESLEALETKMVGVLRDLGIDTEKDLTASDLASNFKSYFLKRTDILKTKDYVLKVSDAALAGSVMSGLEKIGISNTSINRVEHSDADQIRMAMRSKASENARKNALAYVLPLSQEVGPAIFISEENYSFVNQPVPAALGEVVVMGYGEGREKQQEQPPIEFEKIKIEITVDVKFELKQQAKTSSPPGDTGGGK